jgi:APA family basic amino acid/polyamine antiporter
VFLAAPFAFNNVTNTISSTGAILDLPAMLVSLLIMVLLVCGVRDSARFNNAMVAIKVGIVLFVIGLGAALVDTANWSPFAPFGYLGLSFFGKNVTSQATSNEDHAAGVLAGAAIVFFSYIGFDSVSCHAEEAKKPERDVPIALLLSLSISTLLYVAVSLVLCGMIPYHAIDVNAPLSTAFSQRGYHWAGYLIAIGAVVGITSVLLVTMLSQPRIFMVGPNTRRPDRQLEQRISELIVCCMIDRTCLLVLQAMARDGLMPPFFSAIHPRFKTPYKATILTGQPAHTRAHAQSVH